MRLKSNRVRQLVRRSTSRVDARTATAVESAGWTLVAAVPAALGGAVVRSHLPHSTNMRMLAVNIQAKEIISIMV